MKTFSIVGTIAVVLFIGLIALTKYRVDQEFKHPGPSNIHIVVKIDSTWYKNK